MSLAPIVTTPAAPAIPAKVSNPLAAPQPSAPSLPSLIPKISSHRELQQLHAVAIKHSLHGDRSLLSKLVTSLSQNPYPLSIAYAHQLFDRIPRPDAVLFNNLVRAYSRSHHPLRAVSLFCQMLEASILPDAYSFPCLLKACASARAVRQGKQAHAAAVKFGFADNAFVLPTLICMYSQLGDVDAARTLFDRMEDECRSVVSYNSMISACVQSSRPGMAMALFRELQARRLRPTYVTMLGVLAACALIGALEQGRWLHDFVKKNGFTSHVKVNTALIDMYAKCGSLEDAFRVFEEMRLRDTPAWSAMIIAYAIHGYGSAALSLFDEMRCKGIKPDEVTFLGILYACSHSGLVDEGLRYFRIMCSDYSFPPGVKHFGCVVDLLARAGRLEEAYEFINGLPIEPTPILWRTLLSACGVHKNVDLGKKVFDRIIVLDDSHGGDYVIFSNMCALKGMWKDVNRIRKLMSEKGVVKIPGCSSIEVDSTVHEFFAGDGSHPDSRGAHRMVDEVVEQLKVWGYVADTSKVHHIDLTEEEKEVSLRYHSEKLAIAFGLMSTPPGTMLRVVKNLKVCSDCHSMAKMVSLLFGRQIVLRDLNRFHHFSHGECSCGDFW
ncbi:Pentatricopeptide repeat-containing protein [Apostasia shenzhenica]|uniref:Pentatricopeptide repeat-containing protein n=1 Tax=Apostasia shenzhenica TaxID=1088818 RepID=A0A2I0B3J3_9ASPA|nr:Pentatricopeptide repeat-containing protein [Apostasia shenzhenica]